MEKRAIDIWPSEYHAFFQSIDGVFYRMAFKKNNDVFYTNMGCIGERTDFLNGIPTLSHIAFKLKALFWNRIKVLNT